MEKMTLREAFQSLEDIKDECWEYSSSKTSAKKLNENKKNIKKQLKESMSWGDCADVEQAWEKYKKEIDYTYTGDSSDALEFIDKYVKKHPELDNEEDRDAIFVSISAIEEPSDIEEGCKKEESKKTFKRPDVVKECDTNKKQLKERINDTYQSGNVVATTETRHTPMKNYAYVNLTVNGNTYRGKQSWINRTWETYFQQTSLLDAIRKSGLVSEEQIDELRKYNNFQGTLDAFSEMINKKDESNVQESLTEATKIDINNEEDVEKGKEILDDNKNQEVEDNVEQIVDVDAETIDQLKDSYVGNAILQCDSCSTLFYRKPELLVKSDKIVKRNGKDEILWNLGEKCEHCGSEGGYLLVGQVATMDTEVDTDSYDTTGQDEITDEKDTTEIDTNINEQPIEDEYEDEEITFESLNIDRFNKSVNKYLTNLYENVESFTTTNATVDDNDNKLIIEGTIKYKNNKTKNTKFVFESKEITKNNKCLFEGYNETFSPKKNAFTLKTSIKDNTLVVESLKYAYSVKTLNESKLVRGKVSSK